MIGPSQGRMTWRHLHDRLQGYECLWQDLDGVHVAEPPERPPLTSIFWAWPHDPRLGPLVRCRLDGEGAYVATLDPTVALSIELLAAWDAHDQRVRNVRWASPTKSAAGLALERLTEGASAATGVPVVFFRRKPPA